NGRVPHTQMLSIAATADDGDISNATLYPDGETPFHVNYPGFWTSTSQSNWVFYRFQIADAIPAGAVVTPATRLRLWGADGDQAGANAYEFNSINAEIASSTTAPAAASEMPLAMTIYAETMGSGWYVGGGNANVATIQSSVVKSGDVALFINITVNSGWFDWT